MVNRGKPARSEWSELSESVDETSSLPESGVEVETEGSAHEGNASMYDIFSASYFDGWVR